MNKLERRLLWNKDNIDLESLLTSEWIVTNGFGGYASGTLAGVATRRFHGLLVAALPAPLGRVMMFNYLSERIRLPDGKIAWFGGEEKEGGNLLVPSAQYLTEFRLEMGLPVWTYEIEGYVIEKRILLPHLQNTAHITYHLLSGEGTLRLKLQPSVHFRPHEGRVDTAIEESYVLTSVDNRIEISSNRNPTDPLPPLRFLLYGHSGRFTLEGKKKNNLFYRLEAERGYDRTGELWCPGYFSADLSAEQDVTLVASTEIWEIIGALTPQEAFNAEQERRRLLVTNCSSHAKTEIAQELVLAADQFVISPVGRIVDTARAHAAGEDPRTVIAGYHWFTDWGRDTMISLEGLTLVTGRYVEAGWILRTFAHYVRDGLIPNMFPEGKNHGLYHTADATLWFFHALDRYVEVTKDRATLSIILPKLYEIVDMHLKGTHFGIAVDPEDGLLKQGAEGYQLTWMDAKVDGWVVTPRRGKAVEINALWYNALKLLEKWSREFDDHDRAKVLAEHAEKTYTSFNQRFWYQEEGYLYDIVDAEKGGNDNACRPNQILAISLRFPVLDPAHWESVIRVALQRLITPVGLRSLAPGHPDYKPKYFGDLRTRDAAYHQGTVWGWLIGPFIDAWLKLYPDDKAGAKKFLEGFLPHMNNACIGSVSEIFDAEAPFTPRGCVSQAWSVAELLRCWVNTFDE